jgi:hypothetical protein
MLIVTITRLDLRDEFAMAAADEAFALSPISARATLPSEADYDAIREAFMETARGRWFLGEYAKRNRNADTTMVLDAVARIEATIAAQKEAPDNTSDLADALVLIRGMLSDTKADASRAMSGPEAEEALAAVNKGTRIVREIAWRLREYGTDARICDMLDTQIGAIEASHHVTMAPDKRDAVLAIFDLLIRQIGELGGSGSQPAPSDFEAAATPPVRADKAPAERVEATPPTETAPETLDLASDQASDQPPGDATAADITEATAMAAPHTATDDVPKAGLQQSEAEAAVPSPTDIASTVVVDEDVVAIENESADLDDETMQDMAVLDAIALEMAEPEMTEPEPASPGLAEPAQVIEPDFAAPVAAEPAIAEPITVEPAPETALAPEPEPKAPSSLGASLIASGIIARPSSTHDALAPIRRMSQAERIAFFS